MDRQYQGLKANGTWEDFTSNSVEDARPVNSGYERVIDVETNEELK